MSMRISSAALLFTLALAGCDNRPDNEKLAEAEARGDAEAANEGRIACAVGGRDKFSRTCETEQIGGGEQNMLIVRHPDGGFRRFNIVPGLGVEAADGAETAQVSIIEDGLIEVVVGEDRYRLPARMQPGSMSARTSDGAGEQADDSAASGNTKPGPDLREAERAGVDYAPPPAE